MGIESGIVARLNAVAAVTTLTSDRIYADKLPDGTTLPALVYQVVSNTVFSNLSSDTPINQARIQITVIADSKSETITLNDAVITALKRFAGSVSDIEILDSKLDNYFDQSYDLKTDSTARHADYIVTYQ